MHSASPSWIVAASVAAVAAVAAHGLNIVHPSLASLFVENGPAELAQQAALAVAAGLFLLGMRRASDTQSLVLGALAAFAILAFIRETPNCDSPFYEFGPCLSQPTKDGGYVLSGLLVVVFTVMYRVAVAAAFRGGIVRYGLRELRWVWPVLLSVPMLAGADFAEALHSQAAEETGELATYLYLMAFAFSVANLRDEHGSSILEEFNGDLRPGSHRA